jgi:hypothetical protein
VSHVLVRDQSSGDRDVGLLLTNATTVILKFHYLVVIALDQLAFVTWEQITTFAKDNLSLELS